MINCGTIWVCECCALSHANGECCAHPHGGDGGVEPWAAVDFARYSVTAGLFRSEHHEDCENRTADTWVTECDCERWDFARSSCDGCGSYLDGTRYAHTLWRTRQRFKAMPLP